MATTTRHNYDSVDAAKFVLSIFVVAIHVRPFDAYAVYFRPILRAAVPLFFLTTSYFFFNHHKNLSGLEERVLHIEKICFPKSSSLSVLDVDLFDTDH